MEKILVSGSSGFIGKNLCRELIKLNRSVVGTVRNLDSIENENKFLSNTGSTFVDTLLIIYLFPFESVD